MARRNLPDAWEDDWETAADKVVDEPTASGQPTLLTKAERLAKHQETNRKIWESAYVSHESPNSLYIDHMLTRHSEAPAEDFHFLAANNNAPPVTTSFKPAVKLLSRKPAPQMVARKDPTTGLEQLTLQDDEVDEDEAKTQETQEERKARQQRELEEKQRRYEEARAKIFGEPKSNPASGQSTPGNVTPPLSDGAPTRGNYRGRGRGRGGNRGGNHIRTDSQEKRPVSQTNTRELFDPGYAPKPAFPLPKRNEMGPQPMRSTTPRNEEQAIRAPRGPDGSGRGGFGFARRGASDG